ncbi:MAG TPA: hypothetical protein VGE50_10620 [Gammaproteobacteria bacterium]
MDSLFFVQAAGVAFATYLAFAAMWLQYLAVMNLKENRSKLTVAAKLWAYPMLIVGVLSDVLFNLAIGTVVYVELPHELLFTTRCNRHIGEKGWRGNVARWFCRNFMDPFDPAGNHCDGR